MRPPEVSYARSGDIAIAYQVVGDGSNLGLGHLAIRAK